MNCRHDNHPGRGRRTRRRHSRGPPAEIAELLCSMSAFDRIREDSGDERRAWETLLPLVHRPKAELADARGWSPPLQPCARPVLLSTRGDVSARAEVHARHADRHPRRKTARLTERRRLRRGDLRCAPRSASLFTRRRSRPGPPPDCRAASRCAARSRGRCRLGKIEGTSTLPASLLGAQGNSW